MKKKTVRKETNLEWKEVRGRRREKSIEEKTREEKREERTEKRKGM